MEKVKDFCLAFKELKLLPDFQLAPETEEKTMEVFFPHNRSRIIGLPANPDTARGYSVAATWCWMNSPSMATRGKDFRGVLPHHHAGLFD